MNLTPFHVIGFSLPTLALLGALTTPSIEIPRVFRARFGDSKHVFEARFDVNPDGVFSRGKGKAQLFSGSWSFEDREVPVRGVRFLKQGRAVYEVVGARGALHAEEVPGRRRGCPRELRYRWLAPGQEPREGTLSSGVCFL